MAKSGWGFCHFLISFLIIMDLSGIGHSVAKSRIQLPIPLIFNVHMYSEMADSSKKMADSPKIWPIPQKWPIPQNWQRKIDHFKIATFGHLSGMCHFWINVPFWDKCAILINVPFLDECAIFRWMCHLWMNVLFIDDYATFGWICYFWMNVLLLDEP